MTFRDGRMPDPSGRGDGRRRAQPSPAPRLSSVEVARPRVRACAKVLDDSAPVETRDAQLRRAILESLIAAPGLKTRHVGVEVQAGVVTLTGYVNSNAQKAAANVAARRVKGASQLRDTICVAVPCADTPDDAAEAADHRTTLTLSGVLARAAAAREKEATRAQSDDRP